MGSIQPGTRQFKEALEVAEAWGAPPPESAQLVGEGEESRRKVTKE